MLTIADLLTQPNPDFEEAQPVYREVGQTRASSRRNPRWPKLKTLKRWTDFDMGNLGRVFNGGAKAALEKRLEIDQQSELLNLNPQVFNGEDSLKSVLDITHRAIVNRALEGSSQCVIRQDLRMLRGDGATLYLLTSPGAGKAWPDWAVRSSMQGKHCILPGETKTSWTWTSAGLRNCVDSKGAVRTAKAEALWPLRQLAYYCVLSFARYGFMMTDKELVVIKISSCDRDLYIPKTAVREWKEHVEDNLAIEYESIPWKHNPRNTRVMTMNLALWFLHLLAGNNGQLCAASSGSLGDEDLVEQEQKVQFDVKLIDSQSQSQLSQASQCDEELMETTDVMKADPDLLPDISPEEDKFVSTLATREKTQSPTRPAIPSPLVSFRHRRNERDTRNGIRGVLSPKESNTRIQKWRRPSQKRDRQGF